MFEFNRNYGAMTTAREFMGGNNGFLTVAVQMPSATAELPHGASYAAAKVAHENGTATKAQLVRMANAERNLFRIAQACGQRAVIVAVSPVDQSVDATSALGATIDAWEALSPVSGNVLAFGKAGTSATAIAAGKPVYLVTFIIERADVLTSQPLKPGSTYAQSVNPTVEIASNLMGATMGTFDLETSPVGDVLAGSIIAPEAVAVKVFDALPVLR